MVIDIDGAGDVIIDQESRASVGNVIDFNPGLSAFITTGFGYDISVGAGSDVLIANTDATISTSLAEGIVFRDVESVAGNQTTIEITNNRFDFDNLFGANSAVGVDFLSIRGGSRVLLSTQGPTNILTSTVTGQTEFQPNNTSLFQGTILINGTPFPN